jgi:hypothetical protein
MQITYKSPSKNPDLMVSDIYFTNCLTNQKLYAQTPTQADGKDDAPFLQFD